MSVSNMKKLTVFAFREDSNAILRKLMKLRCVEVRNPDANLERFALQRLQSEDELPGIEERLKKIREALPPLTQYTTRKKGLARTVHYVNWEEFRKSGRAEQARKTVADTLETVAAMKKAEAETEKRQAFKTSLLPWVDYDAPLNAVSTEHTKTVLGSFSGKSEPETLEAELDQAGILSEFVSAEPMISYYALTYHKAKEAEAEKLLSAMGFLKTDFEDCDLTADAALQNAEKQIADWQEKREKAIERLKVLSENLKDVEILCDAEETNRKTALLRQKLAATGSCTVLEGWFPVFLEDAVSEVLDKFQCAYETDEPQADEEPPVLLRNNKFASNFEWVLGMYSYPKYGRFDPTFIMSIFYCIIFGLMFADVGYGLLLVAGCFGGIKLLNPRPGMRRTLYMFGLCGICCMVMGVIFGGWFGDLPVAILKNFAGVENTDTGAAHFFGNGLWFNPMNDAVTFLILSLAVGAVHLVTGMAVKFYILCKDGKVLEALCTIPTYWVLFAGLGLFLVDKKIALIVSAIGAGLILFLNGYGIRKPVSRLVKGLSGLYGLISYASDLLSYSRILALGLVASVIAQVINMITALGTNVVGFILMLVILIAGHGLNLAINVLGSFVHTARLQYLEFFGKFYEDGGVPFNPEAPADEFSEEVEKETV